MEKVRVRFAPSPTGYLHVGSLHTVLYNWLFARKNKGRVILRIEDTDRKRFVPGATEKLIEILDWMNLDYDEGPFLKGARGKGQGVKTLSLAEKGKYGPYIQSKRFLIYQKYAKELIKKGSAYYCFCTPERLEESRQEQIKSKLPTRYDRLCRNLSEEEIKEKIKKKIPYVIRLKFPESGNIEFNDLIRGKVVFANEVQDDPVLIKSDGFSTYHLANVVDDHLMEITHVIRGEEWLSSVPKHLVIYQALAWQSPKFAHLSLLFNKDRSKLSKRQGDVAVEDYKDKGYLPEVLFNFCALLGWNPGKGEKKEIFSLSELTKLFSLEKINKAGAIFDLEKLDWMNGWYIRHKKLTELTRACLPYLINYGLIEVRAKRFKITNSGDIVNLKWLEKIVALEQERMKKLSEITELTEFFFREPEYDRGLLCWKKMTDEEIINNLKFLENFLVKTDKVNFKKKYLEKELLQQIKHNSLGVGEILWPMRVALSGRRASPGPLEIAEILGKEKTLLRINRALKYFNA